MSLNPLQNASPRQIIPKEAPSYFSPFFEQPKGQEKISIWQPPPPVTIRRSKAPTNRPRTPPKIISAGAPLIHQRQDVKPATEDKKTLYEPKQKKSLDEIMWLGSVTGFPPRVPPPPKEEPSLRSKLVRKPQQKASQASALAQPVRPKASVETEEQKQARLKKEEAENAREKRLAEWATKKKPAVEEKAVPAEPPKKSLASSFFLPQPVGTTSKTSALAPQQTEARVQASGRRGKVFLPIPQPIETVRRSNRPNQNHRPNLPMTDSSYAPENPILPQPIETAKKSNRPQEQPKTAKKKSEEETIWMGLPQPIETVRRSHRKSPLRQVEGSGDDTEEKKTAEILPQPVETIRRSNRHQQKEESPLTQPAETAVKSTNNLPQPIEVTKKSNRPVPSPLKQADPPTPTTSFFGPSPTLPQPIEIVRRSHRPISARPLIPQPIETSRRSNRARVPPPDMHIALGDLPQPVSVSRWTNRDPGQRHLRRTSTDKLATPGVQPREKERAKKKNWVMPVDHVMHIHEPIDSVPPSPIHSPQSSRCPSLSSSPTSSAASATWETASRVRKNPGLVGRRESFEDGFAGYMLRLERGLRKDGAIQGAGLKKERQKEENEFPFPAVSFDEVKEERGAVSGRSLSLETIKPIVTVANEKETKVDDYPICHSPVFENFKRPQWNSLEDEEQEEEEERGRKRDAFGGKMGFNNSRIPTDELELSKPLGVPVIHQLPTPPDSIASCSPPKGAHPLFTIGGPRAAPPRMYHAMAPSPGYTVASLPPAKKKPHDDIPDSKEIESIVEGLCRYLSLDHENNAYRYDAEVASSCGMDISDVKKDRKTALKKYVAKWLKENPEIEGGEDRKGGLW
ncbi:hypothetical protein RUND412_001763 [Rhizina undulata]